MACKRARATLDSIIPRNLDTKDVVPQDNKDEALPPAVPAPVSSAHVSFSLLLAYALPRYRHAAPSGPWPWMDFNHVDISSPSTAVTNVATNVATDKSDATTAVTDGPQPLQSGWSTLRTCSGTGLQIKYSVVRCS